MQAKHKASCLSGCDVRHKLHRRPNAKFCRLSSNLDCIQSWFQRVQRALIETITIFLLQRSSCKEYHSLRQFLAVDVFKLVVGYPVAFAYFYLWQLSRQWPATWYEETIRNVGSNATAASTVNVMSVVAVANSMLIAWFWHLAAIWLQWSQAA